MERRKREVREKKQGKRWRTRGRENGTNNQCLNKT
jgi:hypothetical protein